MFEKSFAEVRKIADSYAKQKAEETIKEVLRFGK